MSHLLSLSRVARLVGLSRAILQRMAREGELATFDGMVDVEEVLRVFPDIKLEDDTEILRVEGIKEDALAKAQRCDLPDAGVLNERLMALGNDYAAARTLVRHYEIVFKGLETKLGELEDQRRIGSSEVDVLKRWLKSELASPPDNSARLRRLIAQESIMRVMSAHVTVAPKGQHFVVEGDETLLEAGLRAGVSLAYGCSNGSCGQCRARVAAGNVVKVRPHDFLLPQVDKAQGFTLLCAYSPVGDVTIESNLQGVDDIPSQTITTKVRMLERLGGDVLALHLLTPFSRRLRFIAGQSVDVSVNGASARLHVASCPCEERRLELHVRRRVDGAFAEHAFTALKPNDEVQVSGPHGRFVLDDASRRPVLFLVVDHGYAPVKSLVQHALSLEMVPGVDVIWVARGGAHYQENLMKSYAHALDDFHYVPVVCEGEGMLAADTVASRYPDLSGHDIYAAGSKIALDAILGRLRRECALVAERCHVEIVD